MKVGEVYLMRYIKEDQIRFFRVLEIKGEYAIGEFSASIFWCTHKRVRFSDWMYKKFRWEREEIVIADFEYYVRTGILWKKIQ